jgi:hypothetical protein
MTADSPAASFLEHIKNALIFFFLLQAKQEEIQNKVMEILNRPRKTAASLPVAAAPTPAPGSGIAGLNPALQQAIDSLVKTGPNLLSSLGKTGSSSTTGSAADGGGAAADGDKSASSGGGGNLGGYYASLFGGGGGGANGSSGSAMAGAF